MNSTSRGSSVVRIAARSPFRSSAGPATHADAHAELLADDVRERRLAEPRRPDEQDVVERLARGACAACSAIAQLLLDPLLPDELVETSAAGASARSRRPPAGAPGPGTARSCRLQRLADALLRRSLRVGARRARARPRRRVAELDERVARHEVAGAPSGTTCSSPSFSFSSSTTRCAVFLPTPGIAIEPRRVARATIARRSSAGVEPETIASATFGPTPETESSCSNSSRSAGSANPYSCSASSRTCEVVSSVDLTPFFAEPARARSVAAHEVADPATSSTSPSAVRAKGVPAAARSRGDCLQQRRRQRMADRHGERIGRVVGRRAACPAGGWTAPSAAPAPSRHGRSRTRPA